MLLRRRAHRPARVFNVRETSATVNRLAYESDMNQTPLVHRAISLTRAHHCAVSAPQGGTISPLPVNVYLHVLDTSVSRVQQNRIRIERGMGETGPLGGHRAPLTTNDQL
jgi:hypothetical protein